MTLIAERIEDEKTVVQLLEMNVDYGQGFLFGEPKPIRELADTYDPRNPLAAVAQVPAIREQLASATRRAG
jgi:cyclic-di-GMP phosphodiesterase TipF (flagellum assembly factor)